MKELLTNQPAVGYGSSFVNNNNKDAGTSSITGDNNSRRYAMLSTEWISAIGEELGMQSLPDPLLKRLAEDASYHLREVLHVNAIDSHSIFNPLQSKFFSTKIENFVFKISDSD